MGRTIKDLMSKNLVTVEKGTMVKAALEIMERNKFRHLPVVDEFSQIIGILSDRDFLVVTDFENMKVDGAMTSIVATVTADASIKKSVLSMVERKISCLVVVDSGAHPIGIVTTDDILKEFAKLQE